MMTWIDSRKEYDRARYLKRKSLLQKLYQENREERLSWQKKYNLAHKKERAAYNKKYFSENKERTNTYMREYMKDNQKYRIRHRAHSAVGYALRTEKLKTQSCEVCGSSKVEAHHCDYNKPLDVIWLCKEHHEEWHMKNKPLYPKEENNDLDEL